jgi:hypothetical protein
MEDSSGTREAVIGDRYKIYRVVAAQADDGRLAANKPMTA